MPSMTKLDTAKVVEVSEILIPEGWMIVNIKTMNDFVKLAKNYAEILRKDNIYYLLSESNIIFVYRE